MIYEYKGLPAAWVVLVDEQHWIVPASANGWALRKQFRGHKSALLPVPNYNLIGLGVPHQSRVSADEIQALRDKIEAAGLSQEAAGTLVYAPLRTVQDWLTGKRQMQRAIYERLIQQLVAR